MNKLFFIKLCLILVLGVLGLVNSAYAQTSFDASGSNGGAIIPGWSSDSCVGTIDGAIRYNSGTQGIELCAAGTWTSLIGGGGLMGKVTQTAATNCIWSSSSTSYTTLSTNDNDCNALTVSGSASAPTEGKIPAIRFVSLPAGDYEVIFNVQMFNVSGSIGCNYRITDGTNYSGWTYIDQSTWTKEFIIGTFNYGSTQSNITFYLQTMRDFGSGSCSVGNDISQATMTITVKAI